MNANATSPAPSVPALLTLRLLQVASDPTLTTEDRAWSVMVETLWLLIGTTPRGTAMRGHLERAYDDLTDRGGERLELVRQTRRHFTRLTDQTALVALDLLDAYTYVSTVDATVAGS